MLKLVLANNFFVDPEIHFPKCGKTIPTPKPLPSFPTNAKGQQTKRIRLENCLVDGHFSFPNTFWSVAKRGGDGVTVYRRKGKGAVKSTLEEAKGEGYYPDEEWLKINITDKTTTVGRLTRRLNESSDHTISATSADYNNLLRQISRHHCTLTADNCGNLFVTFENTPLKNFINGCLIPSGQRTLVKTNDMIRLGGEEKRVYDSWHPVFQVMEGGTSSRCFY